MTSEPRGWTPDRPATREDAAFAYRLFLGREAESGAVLDASQGSSWADLLAGFTSSAEFRARLLRPVLEDGRPSWAPATEADDVPLAGWVRARFDPLPEADAPPLLARVLQRMGDSAPRAEAELWTYVADRLRLIAEPIPVVAPEARRLAASIVLDGSAAAQRIAALSALRELDELGRSAAGAEAALLTPPDAFDATLYFNGERDAAPRQAALAQYFRGSRWTDFRRPLEPARSIRRSLPGFHPQIYATEAADFPPAAGHDPLAHYIGRGRPAGRWRHDVILLPREDPAPRASRLRAALHGHFHHTEHASQLTRSLARNASPLDLFLTTTQESAAEELRGALADWDRGAVHVEVTPNRGRDIGPMLGLLRERVLGRYDVLGHVHGKRSAHAVMSGLAVGDRWRDFLWRMLLGPDHPTADMVLRRFEEDASLGLVFPESETLMGWTHNKALALALAPRLGLSSGGLPDHIEFPMGMMFWARVDALRPLVDAALREEEYPPEPVPEDGTLLHAIERLLPLMVEAHGYRYATTYDPDVSRWR